MIPQSKCWKKQQIVVRLKTYLQCRLLIQTCFEIEKRFCFALLRRINMLHSALRAVCFEIEILHNIFKAIVLSLEIGRGVAV